MILGLYNLVLPLEIVVWLIDGTGDHWLFWLLPVPQESSSVRILVNVWHPIPYVEWLDHPIKAAFQSFNWPFLRCVLERGCTSLSATDLHVSTLQLRPSTVWSLLFMAWYLINHVLIAGLGEVSCPMAWCRFMIFDKRCQLIVIGHCHRFWAVHRDNNWILSVPLSVEPVPYGWSLCPLLVWLSVLPWGVHFGCIWCNPCSV